MLVPAFISWLYCSAIDYGNAPIAPGTAVAMGNEDWEPSRDSFDIFADSDTYSECGASPVSCECTYEMEVTGPSRIDEPYSDIL